MIGELDPESALSKLKVTVTSNNNTSNNNLT